MCLPVLLSLRDVVSPFLTLLDLEHPSLLPHATQVLLLREAFAELRVLLRGARWGFATLPPRVLAATAACCLPVFVSPGA